MNRPTPNEWIGILALLVAIAALILSLIFDPLHLLVAIGDWLFPDPILPLEPTPTHTSTPTPILTTTPSPTPTDLVTELHPVATPATYSISGRVLIQADGEAIGLEGAKITLYRNPDCSEGKSKDEQFLLEVWTSSGGTYAFKGRPPDCYLVELDPEQESVNGIASVHVLEEDRTDVDFWVEPERGSISGSVWLDTDRDGEKDPGEPGDARFRLMLWIDANCDEIPEKVKVPPRQASIQADGSYAIDDLSLEPCYVLELEKTEEAMLTTGEAVAHVVLQESDAEVSFGYCFPDAEAASVPAPVDPNRIQWTLIDSPECSGFQNIFNVEKAPGGLLLSITGVAKAPPNMQFEKYELHYAFEGCTTWEECYFPIATKPQVVYSDLAEWYVGDFSEGQRMLIRLRVVASAHYDDGCKAWVTIP